MHENSEEQNNNNIESVPDTDAEHPELESELTKKKAAEKRAKLVNQIWGDKFLSDSLH